MKLLFIQGGTRVKEDKEGNYYTDGNFNDKVWSRYKSYCDELTVILRREEKIYEKEYAQTKFNKFNTNQINLITLEDIYRPIKKYFNSSKKKQIKKTIKEEIKKADKVILRSMCNFYTITALKYCKKYNRPYFIEVTGVAFDGFWYHGDIFGKIVAIPYEFIVKKSLKNAPYALYVTEETLQKRYPCKGTTLGCSDVEIYNIDVSNLKHKIEQLKNKENNKIILGTAAWINLKTKGQKDVIKSLYKLKKRGISKFEYQLVGLGDQTFIQGLIKKYNLENEVKILGPKTHEEVFNWLKNIDIYIQPSYQEGLCRAIVEAMSMGCPVVASNAGGNSELIDKKYIFKKGNIKELTRILEKLEIQDLVRQAELNFEKSKKYKKEDLDKKRDEFYKSFVSMK